jgi:hypothetical protein
MMGCEYGPWVRFVNGSNELECFVPDKHFQPSVIEQSSLLGQFARCKENEVF